MANLGAVSKLILGFVALLLGAVLIGVIASQGLLVTDKTAVTAELHSTDSTAYCNGKGINDTVVHTLTNAPTGWQRDDNSACPVAGFEFSNATEALTETTDYTVDLDAGTYVLVSTDLTNDTCLTDNITYAKYTYCADDYMNLSWGRTGINLVSGFFALGLMITGVGLFYSVAKDTGML